MEQKLNTYGFSKETITTIMMIRKNTEAMVCSSDADTDFFDIDTRVLQVDALVLYIYIYDLPRLICWNIDKSNLKNDITLKMVRHRRYPAETMVYADYADDLALLVNIPA